MCLLSTFVLTISSYHIINFSANDRKLSKSHKCPLYVFAVLRKKDAHSCAQAHSEMLSYFAGWVPQMSSKRHISNMNFQYWALLAVGVQPIAFKLSFRDLKTSKNAQISKKRKKALFLQDFLVFRFSCHLLQCTALLRVS